MQLRSSAFALPSGGSDAIVPLKSGGKRSGSRTSPRVNRKMRSGDSTKTPVLDAETKPGLANGAGHRSTS